MISEMGERIQIVFWQQIRASEKKLSDAREGRAEVLQIACELLSLRAIGRISVVCWNRGGLGVLQEQERDVLVAFDEVGSRLHVRKR